jgi:ABC-type thiamine transport system substrate-binding protein
MLTDVSDRSQSGQTMKRLILWAIVPIVIVACALAYWLGPDLFARQTLTIANESERAVTVMIYDHVWTMTPGETVEDRFAAEGDAHFEVVDASTGETLATPGYLTSGMAQCHVITIRESVDYLSGLDENC